MDDREGMYAEWTWCPIQKCWEYLIPMRIYPGDGSGFTISADEVWQAGIYDTFEAAEIAVLDISEEQAAADIARVAKMG